MNKLLRLGFTAVLLTYIGYKTDWPKVGEAFADLRIGYWLAAVGLLMATQCASVLRWRIFASQLGLKRSFTRLSGYFYIGMFYNLLLPTAMGGDVVRVWYLGGPSGKKRAAAAVVLDRLNGLLVLIAVACVAVLFAPPSLPEWMYWCGPACAIAALGGALGMFALSRWGRLPPHRQRQIDLMWEVFRNPRSLLATTLLSLVVQTSSFVMVFLVGQGLGIDVPLGYYAVFVPIVVLVTMLPVSVNGMVLREETTALFLAPLGVSHAVGVTLAILWFSVYLTVSLMGGLVVLFGHFPKPVAQTGPESTTDVAVESALENGLENGAGVRGVSALVEKDVDHGSVDCDPDQGREGQLGRAA